MTEGKTTTIWRSARAEQYRDRGGTIGGWNQLRLEILEGSVRGAETRRPPEYEMEDAVMPIVFYTDRRAR